MADQRPDKAPDVFASSYVVESGPYGMSLSFYRSEPRTEGRIGGQGRAVGREELVGTVRMTMEHGLMMVFTLWQHLAAAQKAHGRIPIPDVVMKATNVDPRAWGLFWYGEEPPVPHPLPPAPQGVGDRE